MEAYNYVNYLPIDVELGLTMSDTYFALIEDPTVDMSMKLTSDDLMVSADVCLNVRDLATNEELLLLARVDELSVFSSAKIDGSRFSIYQHSIESDVTYHEISNMIESEFLPELEIEFKFRSEEA